jgi:hypothetical protein
MLMLLLLLLLQLSLLLSPSLLLRPFQANNFIHRLFRSLDQTCFGCCFEKKNYPNNFTNSAAD